MKIGDKVKLKKGVYFETKKNPLNINGEIVSIDDSRFIVNRDNGETNSYKEESLKTIGKTRIQIRGKEKKNDNIDEPSNSMTALEMADILNKAMSVIKSNGLESQMQQAESDNENLSGSNSKGSGGSNDKREDKNIYVFYDNSTNTITSPIVGHNIKEVLDYLGIKDIMFLHMERYTEPQQSQGLNHEGLTTPFYY